MWLGGAGLYGYIFFFASGLGAIPWFLMGEIFPAEVKGVASSIATAVNWGLSFVITKTVNMETDALGGQPKGLGGVFAGYGVICLLGIAFVVCFVPETKGKSFDEVRPTRPPLLFCCVWGLVCSSRLVSSFVSFVRWSEEAECFGGWLCRCSDPSGAWRQPEQVLKRPAAGVQVVMMAGSTPRYS